MNATSHIDPVMQAAVDWFAKLQGEPDAEAWAAFQAWLEHDPGHRDAYDIVEGLWLDLEESAVAGSAADSAAEVVPFPSPRRGDAARRGASRRLFWGAGLSAAAAAAIAAVIPFGGATPSLTTYSTVRGQTQAVTLADGSHLTLGSATTLKVRLSRRERQVALIDGEASFDVSHDPSRHFVIAAGDREVTVVGTEFDVVRHSGRLTVTVRRGVVMVAPMAGGADANRLVRGDALRHAEGASSSTVARVDPDDAFAWREGRLIYRQAPMSQVAEDLSRYFAVPVIVDPGAADARVSGVLPIGSQAEMIRRLELFAPIDAQSAADKIVLKARS